MTSSHADTSADDAFLLLRQARGLVSQIVLRFAESFKHISDAQFHLDSIEGFVKKSVTPASKGGIPIASRRST